MRCYSYPTNDESRRPTTLFSSPSSSPSYSYIEENRFPMNRVYRKKIKQQDQIAPIMIKISQERRLVSFIALNQMSLKIDRINRIHSNVCLSSFNFLMYFKVINYKFSQYLTGKQSVRLNNKQESFESEECELNKVGS